VRKFILKREWECALSGKKLREENGGFHIQLEKKSAMILT
jgi:hypothetical protein